MREYAAKKLAEQDHWGVPGGSKFSRVSFMGKEFAVVFDGERIRMEDEAGHALSTYDFVLVRPADYAGRKFYEKGWKLGDKNPPDCRSDDGIYPDPSSPKLQAKTCNDCRWSKWRTAVDAQGNQTGGQRCSSFKLMGILPSGDLMNEEFNGPSLISIPPTSFPAWREYYKEQRKLGRDPSMIHTRMSFAGGVGHTQLQFEFAGFLTQDEFATIEWWNTPGTEGYEQVDEMLRTKASDIAGIEQEEGLNEQPVAKPVPSTASRLVPGTARPAAATAAGPATAKPAPTARPAPAARSNGQPATVMPSPARAAGLRPGPAPAAAASPAAQTRPAPGRAPAKITHQPQENIVQLKPATRATQAPAAVRPKPASAAPVRTGPARPQAASGTMRPARPVSANGQARPANPRAGNAADPDFARLDGLIQDVGTDFDIQT
jgi:hypothetical protein